MKEFKHVIADPLGMHARPAGMLVKAVAPFASKVTIEAPTGKAECSDETGCQAGHGTDCHRGRR